MFQDLLIYAKDLFVAASRVRSAMGLGAAVGPPLARHLSIVQHENAARGDTGGFQQDFSNRYAFCAHIP
jgi:hypothetical protein